MDLAQLHEMAAALMDEAAVVLSTIKPEHQPANFRWPLADELSGTAAMLRDHSD